MRAAIHERYGPPDVLKLQEIDRPAIGPGDVRVQVRASSVNPADWHLMRATPALLIRPTQGLIRPKRKILGFDLAGTVEAIGPEVTRFRPGDDVFGISRGTFGEFHRVTQDRLVLKPAGVTYEEAAAVPVAALTALQGLRTHGQIHSGQKVLINGAAGGVGTFAVQIAKSLGAEVTGVCSTRNLELVGQLGADHVVDYTKQDFTREGQRYDLLLDAVGNRSLSDCKRALSSDGIFVAAAGSPARSIWMTLTGGKRMRGMLAKPNQRDLEFLSELLESGAVTPVIDRRYPLSEIADAIRYLEQGHARGKVIITI